ncbi:MAG: hypothetical protein FJ202_00895 [Gemmatimonadetes bacterium]|nr:hypothetical protein [Gemmatimonadota bacterium]
MTTPTIDHAAHAGRGDVFAKDLGAMIVHVQREIGLAHQTFVLGQRQIFLVRLASQRWARWTAAAAVVLWMFTAAMAVRVPVLQARLSRVASDAARLDSLEATMVQLQARYDQLQGMLSRPGASAPAGTAAPTRPQP